MNVLCSTRQSLYRIAESQATPVLSSEPTQPKSREDEWSSDVRSEFISGGLNYFYTKSLARVEQWWSGLKSSPKVQLDRPVIFVSGFLAPSHQFDTTLEHLVSEGLNGGAVVYVKDGQFYSDEKATQLLEPPPEAKVFKLVTGRDDTPVQIADSLEAADLAIKSRFGPDSLDVIAHSLGGLGARLFCDRGNKAGRVCLVGTPNQGSRAAMLTKAAVKNDIGWAAAMAHVGPASVAALEWMVPTVNGNPKLAELNARWEEQVKSAEDMMIIAASGIDSPHSFESSGPGDGLIELESTAAGDIPRLDLDGDGRKNHFTQVNDPEVFDEFRKFFGWREIAASTAG